MKSVWPAPYNVRNWWHCVSEPFADQQQKYQFMFDSLTTLMTLEWLSHCICTDTVYFSTGLFTVIHPHVCFFVIVAVRSNWIWLCLSLVCFGSITFRVKWQGNVVVLSEHRECYLFRIETWRTSGWWWKYIYGRPTPPNLSNRTTKTFTWLLHRT